MSTTNRFGEQPARQVLRERKIPLVKAARDTQTPYNHVKFVLLGMTPPKPSFLKSLCDYLDLPPEALFTPAALHTPFLSQFGRRPRRSA